MIRTLAQNTADNSLKFQGIKQSIEDYMALEKEPAYGSEANDEFSSLLDKIAARFSKNLGFDYTSLLNTNVINTEAVQAKLAELKQNKIEGKGEVSQKTDSLNTKEEKTEASPEFRADTKVENFQDKNSKSANTSTKSSKSDDQHSEVKADVKQTETPKQAVESKAETTNVDEFTANVKTELKEVRADVSKAEVKATKTAESNENGVEAETTAEVAPEIMAKANRLEKADKPASESKEKEIKKTKLEGPTEEAAVMSPTEGKVENSSANIEKVPASEGSANAKEAGLKETAKNAAGLLNAAVLAELYLKSTFMSKDQNLQQASQSQSNMQATKSISDSLKDKIVTSMNNALNNTSLNMSGSFSAKNSSEKTVLLKEKAFAQQPQILKAFEKVESALKEAAKARDGKTISLRLDPPNLGSVKVDVSLREGSLHARISADNQTINAVLREYSHDLQQALRKLGLSVEKIIVSVNSSEFGHDRTGENRTNDNGGQNGHTNLGKDGSERGSSGSNEENFNMGNGPYIQTDVNQFDHWVA